MRRSTGLVNLTSDEINFYSILYELLHYKYAAEKSRKRSNNNSNVQHIQQTLHNSRVRNPKFTAIESC